MFQKLILVLSIVTFTGCSGGGSESESADNIPLPSKDDIAAIQKHLAALSKPQTWSGERWKTVALKDGYPVIESIGAWQMKAVPATKGNPIDLGGIKIGEEQSVSLDLDKGILLINGVVFTGRPITGKTPMLKDAPYKGAVFERETGSFAGKASILFVEDGRRALVDFYKVWSKGKRGEYGILSSAKVSE